MKSLSAYISIIVNSVFASCNLLWVMQFYLFLIIFFKLSFYIHLVWFTIQEQKKANSKTASNNDVRVLSKQKCIVDICTLLVITIVTFFVFPLGYDDEDGYVPAGTSAY